MPYFAEYIYVQHNITSCLCASDVTWNACMCCYFVVILFQIALSYVVSGGSWLMGSKYESPLVLCKIQVSIDNACYLWL